VAGAVGDVTRDPGADAAAPHPRRRRSHSLLQVETVLQRRSRPIRLCLPDGTDHRLRLPASGQTGATTPRRSGETAQRNHPETGGRPGGSALRNAAQQRAEPAGAVAFRHAERKRSGRIHAHLQLVHVPVGRVRARRRQFTVVRRRLLLLAARWPHRRQPNGRTTRARLEQVADIIACQRSGEASRKMKHQQNIIITIIITFNKKKRKKKNDINIKQTKKKI